MEAIAVLGNEVVELRRLASGGRDEVAGAEGGFDEGAAQPTRGTGDEPGLFHVPSTTRFS
jgi:hypothetical protein